MRVPRDILTTVSFIAEDVSGGSDSESKELWATGFFVSVPAKTLQKVYHHYFVTAKHVADSLLERPIGFSVNSKSGGLIHVLPWPFIHEKTGEKSHAWFSHPDDHAVDVSVTPVTIPEDADTGTVSVDIFIQREDLDVDRIGIGDEVFMVGLFQDASGGTDRNTPIVRHGNLAMIPHEDVYIESGFSEVYLIEARSIGGLSGSPVFIRRTMSMAGENSFGKSESLQGIGTQPYLLGLAHGHWDVKESEINSPRIVHDSQRGVNLGIAIVVPAHKILEVINQPKLASIRDRFEERVRSIVPRMDSR